jgi:hypothetical protein
MPRYHATVTSGQRYHTSRHRASYRIFTPRNVLLLRAVLGCCSVHCESFGHVLARAFSTRYSQDMSSRTIQAHMAVLGSSQIRGCTAYCQEQPVHAKTNAMCRPGYYQEPSAVRLNRSTLLLPGYGVLHVWFRRSSLSGSRQLNNKSIQRSLRYTYVCGTA